MMHMDLALLCVTGRKPDAERAVADVYKLYEATAGVEGCTPDKADDFVKWFRVQMAQEAKDPDVKSKRLEALYEIRAFIAVGSPKCTAFAHVDRHQFAVELALRVRKPRSIAQNYANASGGVNMCGSNMMIIDFAKRDPLAFARFAMALADRGTGMLWHATVTPEPQIRNIEAPSRLAPVDFVLLASLRYTDAYYIEFLDTIKSHT